MSGVGAGIALALLASMALNGSYLLQHAGSRGAPALVARHPLRSARALAGARLWVLGLLCGLAGWGLHVAALSAAQLSLVQAFSAGGIALAAPVAALTLRARLGPRERSALAVVVLALALLAVGARDGGRTAQHPLALGAGLGLAALAAAALGALPAGPRRAHALGLAAGLLYGAADAATKALTGVAHTRGVAAALSGPWLLAVLGLSAGAFLAFQRGLQLGPPVPVVALMTAATNAVAIGAGLAAFGDPLGATPALAALHGGALALAAVGVWRLAPAQARLAGEAEELGTADEGATR